jgi:radical SAM superfamily enzyme YgiQ (UPF0313 family)
VLHQKVLILNFPKISLDAPPLAPAILSAICDKLSVDHDFIDCNLEFQERLSGNQRDEILGKYAERFIEELSPESRNWLDNYFDFLAKVCKQYDLVAISVFSVHSVVLTYDFLSRCREQISAKIVVGGPGLKSNGVGDSGQASAEPFYKTLHSQNLIDYWVLGEGELAFEHILTGQALSTEINNEQFNSLSNFDQVPVPNFEKFNLEKYMISGKRIASVEGSRSCVKKCTFCDINNTWGKFKFKDGERLSNELLTLHQKYNIDHFWFNDSLINGSMKAFREFTQHLSKMQKSKFTWSGQAIVRPQSTRDREDFELMKNSGCSALAVGLESFSERSRFHMGKKFTDDDLDKFLRLAQEFNISVVLLLIVGYPTETQWDIERSFEQLEKYSYLADDGTISFLRIGNTMTIIPDTPIWYQIDKLGIEINKNNPSLRLWKKGENTLENRIKWRMELEDHARALGYNCLDKEMHVEEVLLTLVKNLYEKSNTD